MTILQDRFTLHSIEIKRYFELESTEVQLPRNQLLQLLINLLKNSLEAVILQQERSRGEEYCGEVSIRLQKSMVAGEQGAIDLQVSDNGVGSELGQQEKLFTSGFTTKRQGSGLGLHSAANFIQSIGGEMQFISPGAGQGDTVKVLLPLTG